MRLKAQGNRFSSRINQGFVVGRLRRHFSRPVQESSSHPRLRNRLDPVSGDQFVALGQGVNAVPDPVGRLDPPGGRVEDVLCLDENRLVLGGKLRHNRPKSIDLTAPRFPGVLDPRDGQYERLQENDLQLGIRVA